MLMKMTTVLMMQAVEKKRKARKKKRKAVKTALQQEDDVSKDEDESAVVSRPPQLQQQLPQPGMTGFAAVAAAGDDSVLAMQQMSQQHTEHMHVAVRARPVPSGSSSSCWTVDPSTAVVTLNASQTAAKRKQAQHGQGVLRSSNSNGSFLDGGLSRGLLGSAPSTPNVWDPSGTSGTSMGYKFDQVLNEDAETAAVYASCIQSLVQSALEGVNGTVLAYGKTLDRHSKLALCNITSFPMCIRHCSQQSATSLTATEPHVISASCLLQHGQLLKHRPVSCAEHLHSQALQQGCVCVCACDDTLALR